MNHPRGLSVPEAGPAHFSRNFIRQAVCELRFPTLFEIESDRPPLEFASRLRQEFPVYESLQDVKVGPVGVAPGRAHMFSSKRSRWTVTLRAAAISIATNRYESFEEFFEKLELVVKAAADVIDSDFFTRVGLRYINNLPFGDEDLAKWLNPDLIGVVSKGLFGEVREFSGRVAGDLDIGGFLFQHGLALDAESGRAKSEYVLDFDFFSEDIEIGHAATVIKELHSKEFSLFRWALGERAMAFLDAPTKR
ncbi:TIGR04255 family protein [Paraburkholderia bannensis]|nr:TIGR04255 family protein [Paraburkholderia bannensis]RQM44440.1 TIGR04255 family protein [Paraburkholderia bannensis]